MGNLAELLTRQDAQTVVEQTPCLDRLRGKRLFLSGGTGFVGSWLLEIVAYFNDSVSDPCQVQILTRNPEAFAAKAPHLARHMGFSLVCGDVHSFPYSGAACDFVIHAATTVNRRLIEAEPLDTVKTIVQGTERVLDMAARMGVERFLFVSSGAVYGTQSAECEYMAETYSGSVDLGVPQSTYAEGKRLAEVLCAIWREHDSLPVCIARPFTFVGPYQNLDYGFAVTDLIRDGLANRPLRVTGDGTAVRSYGYGADLARDLLTVLLTGQVGRAYNVGSDEALNVTALAQMIAGQMQSRGWHAGIQIAQVPMANVAPNRYVPDLSRIRSELGIRPLFSLDQALDRTISWAAGRQQGRES
jgi:dTDP-glucose 4,6-dehydratase